MTASLPPTDSAAPPWYPPPGYYRPADPGPSVGWAVALWIVAGLSLVGTLVCGAMAGYAFSISHHMATEGVTTTAVVSEVDSFDEVTLDFTTDSGQQVTARCGVVVFRRSRSRRRGCDRLRPR